MSSATRTTPADTYNYERFEPGPYVNADCAGPLPGVFLGDVPVRRLDGTPTTLGELADGVLVVETGSTTCPLYRRNIVGMRDVARDHPDATFVMLYTREAHPGERQGPHRDLADKHAAAATLSDAAGEWRQVLVDDLDGSLHRRLEGAPDSVTILDRDGTVLAYFHDGSPRAVATALDRLRAGTPLDGIRSTFTPPTPAVALAALLTGGWRALGDFLHGAPTLAAYRLRGGHPC